MAFRYLSKVAIGATAGYLVLRPVTLLLRSVSNDDKAPIEATTSGSVVHQLSTFDQAPLNSFATITVPTAQTASVMTNTPTATAIVTEYVTIQAPFPTSVSGAYATYPYTTSAAIFGVTCFAILVLCAIFTFPLWCQHMLAEYREKKRIAFAKQKLEDFENAPCKITWLAGEAAKHEAAKRRSGASAWEEFE